MGRTEAHVAGLSTAAAAARLRSCGLNLIERRRKLPLVLEFLLRFRNPLVVLLIGSSIVLGWTGDMTSTVIIIVMVVASVTLDFVQEHRAARAVERLQATVAATARVLRDGVRHEIPVAQIVPGDIVFLEAGDVIPADGNVIEAQQLCVNEAALTGESYPVEKSTQAASAILHMGTSVVTGEATLVVTATGNATALGSVAHMLEEPETSQPLERGMREFGMMILRVTLFLVLFVLLVNALFHRPLLESFVFAVALAVGLTPELLPMIVSVTLAHGALRLAGKHVIVKRLAAIYGLGGMDVLCTDKTGTLTEAKIHVAGWIDAQGAQDRRVLELAHANSRLTSGVHSPLDEALLAVPGISSDGLTKLSEAPFDFDRRRVSVLVERTDGARMMLVKGAPEDLLRLCTSFEVGSDVARPLDGVARGTLEARFTALGEAGFRVLAIARRDMQRQQGAITSADEKELAFVGFVTFFDPPRHDAAEALAGLARAGIAVKIVTGDNERVARHVCGVIGLPVERVISGSDIRNLSDDDLAAAADGSALFCRVSPEQKTRIIHALQQRKRIVGFMGDGINDAPALRAADVGISVQGAVGVAREAADIILTRGRLGVVREGVLEGRRTYANIMKYLMMATSSNFGNMLSMAAATLFLPFLPLLPVQILANNLLYDVSEVAIPLDRVEEIELRRPRVWDMHEMRRFMLLFGPISSIFDLLTFGVLMLILNADAALFRTGWFVESLATQVLVIFVIRTRRNVLQGRPHPLLTTTSLLIVGTALALPFTPAGALIGLVPLPLPFFVMLLALVALYLGLAEYAKHRFHQWHSSTVARHPRKPRPHRFA